ncbi:MAG: hypothetical protein IPN51_00105 [Chloracidobacterium sp.]|nr:hypothetical protein [Chloracidobacterium sp.]
MDYRKLGDLDLAGFAGNVLTQLGGTTLAAVDSHLTASLATSFGSLPTDARDGGGRGCGRPRRKPCGRRTKKSDPAGGDGTAQAGPRYADRQQRAKGSVCYRRI